MEQHSTTGKRRKVDSLFKARIKNMSMVVVVGEVDDRAHVPKRIKTVRGRPAARKTIILLCYLPALR